MILILDFGSQLTHLIARRLRELGVYCEIATPTKIPDDDKIEAFILSGGPQSVYDQEIPYDPKIFTSGKPILGLCYGHQLIAHHLGGKVKRGSTREYGSTQLNVLEREGLFAGLGAKETVWMSHGDTVTVLPPGFRTIGESKSCQNAAIADYSKKIFGLQFHPEVHHTKNGMKLLENFLEVCSIKREWKVGDQKERLIQEIRSTVGEGSVVMGVSGGVDSLVCSVLLEKAIGKRLYCVYVDTGLMRKNDTAHVSKIYKELGFANFKKVDASEIFLTKLAGVTDPEEKRKIIGHTFIEVFEGAVEGLKGEVEIGFLGQGTIYPDRIESGQPSESAAKIKSHHNLTLPEKMKLKLVEPLREFYKDGVRELGETLGVKKEYLWRHPFPGPGLAIRVLGAVDREKVGVVREADHIFIEELKRSGEYDKVWQALAALLPVKTVGVMGDSRTYEYMIALRAVTSTDAMTADWARLPPDFLERVSNRIINEVKGVNRVVYDITQKPPGTIEYE